MVTNSAYISNQIKWKAYNLDKKIEIRWYVSNKLWEDIKGYQECNIGSNSIIHPVPN